MTDTGPVPIDGASAPDRVPFLEQAGGRGAWSTLLMTLVAIVILVFAQTGAYLLLIRPAEAMAVRDGAALLPTLAWFAGLFGSFGVVILLLVWIMPGLHGRSWRTLIAPDRRIDWGLLARSALLWGAIGGGGILLSATLGGEGPRADFDAVRLLSVIALTVWFVLIQVSAEELLFRGYLSQGLHRWLRRPWLIALPVALLFAAVHLGTHVGLPTFLLLMGISLFLSWITWRADRIEPAIGVHFAQNATSIYLVGWELIPAPSVFEPMETMTVGWGNLIGLAVAVGLYALVGVRWGLVLRR